MPNRTATPTKGRAARSPWPAYHKASESYTRAVLRDAARPLGPRRSWRPTVATLRAAERLHRAAAALGVSESGASVMG